MNDHALSRQSVLAFSILISLLLHALLLLLAPSITVIRARTTHPSVIPISLHLIDSIRPQPPTQTDNADIQRLASRPEKIEDLISRTPESIGDASADPAFAPVPQLEQRTAGRDLPREYDTAMSDELRAQLDARILEIEEQAAREEIKVARRVVAPSNTRIVEEGEYPFMRGDKTDSTAGVLAIEPFMAMPSVQPDEAESAPAGSDAQVAGIINEILAAAPPPIAPPEAIPAGKQIKAEIESSDPNVAIDEMVKVDLTTYVPERNGTGYFRVRIAPGDKASFDVLPKNVTLIVDASNSIAQPKLDLTVKGVINSLRTLRPDDQFNIIIFRDQSTPFQPQPVPATPDNIAAAAKFLSGLKSTGETNVYEAIRPVLQALPQPGVANIVMLVSDGRPTKGVKDAQMLINILTDENARKNTIFALGGGKTVNRYLLDLLAYRNRGESVVASRMEALTEELPRFFENLSEPILVQCDADVIHVDTDELFPRDLSDFYRGRAVTLYGVFDPKKDEEFVMRLTGRARDARKELIFRGKFADAAKGTEEIARNWAFRKAVHIIGEMCRVGETPELMSELQDLSARYRINTIYNQP